MKRLTLVLLFACFFCRPASIPALSTKDSAPEFVNVPKWINTETPLKRKDFEGKVTLLAFWNLNNLQSLRDLKILMEWHDDYRNFLPLEIIGIYVYETEFQENEESLAKTIRKKDITFPIALDANQSLTKAYGVTKIPAYILIDRQGRLQGRWENLDTPEPIEEKIRLLLREIVPRHPIYETPNRPSFSYDSAAEIILGYRDLSKYGNVEKVMAGQILDFRYPTDNPRKNTYYLQGKWMGKEKSFETGLAPSSIKITMKASRVYLLAGSTRNTLTPAEVRWDNQPLHKSKKGKELAFQGDKSYVFVRDYKLYEILRSPEKSGEHTLEIVFQGPGIEVLKISYE